MRILVAEDDLDSRRVLQVLLAKWGYEVTYVDDGERAWEALRSPDAPPMAILDWMMPGIDGVEVVRMVRALYPEGGPYILLLTARTNPQDIIEGLEAGANDYVTKPFHRAELRARVGVGERMVELQSKLQERVRELQDALAHVRHLQGLLPICTYCKKVRDDEDSWQQIETYVSRHSDATFSHGICPECLESVWRPQLEAARKRRDERAGGP